MNSLVVFVKAPVAGRVKTRLCPPLSSDEAAMLYRAFVEDTLDNVSHLSDLHIEVAYASSPEFPDISWLDSPPPYFVQEGESLGLRLQHAFTRAFANGARKTVIIGSDSPHLPKSVLARAFTDLDNADLVLGPAEDGGYYLVGLREPRPALFEGISWSTAGVLAATLRRASESHLNFAKLDEEFDIDDFAALERLADKLRWGHRQAPKTLDAIQRLSVMEKPSVE